MLAVPISFSWVDIHKHKAPQPGLMVCSLGSALQGLRTLDLRYKTERVILEDSREPYFERL